jgi:hypothetical protein
MYKQNITQNQIISGKRQWLIRNSAILPLGILFIVKFLLKINATNVYIIAFFTALLCFFILIEAVLFGTIYIDWKFRGTFQLESMISYQKNKPIFLILFSLFALILTIMVYILFSK